MIFFKKQTKKENPRRKKKTYLPLAREVTETSGDTKQETVKLRQVVGGDDRVLLLGRCMEQFEDIVRECFRDSGTVDICGLGWNICALDAFWNRLRASVCVLIDGC